MSKRKKVGGIRAGETAYTQALRVAKALREAEEARIQAQHKAGRDALSDALRIAELMRRQPQPIPIRTVGTQIKREPVSVVRRQIPPRARRRSLKNLYAAQITQRLQRWPVLQEVRAPLVCARRKLRRVMMFVTGKFGRGNRSPRRSLNSQVRC